MKKLYHGSGFDQDELKPGIKHTGKLVKWDQTESNEWLYATSSMEEAIAQGFASVLEKHFKVSRYKSDGDDLYIEIEAGRVPSVAEMKALDIWLYTIEWHDCWRHVNNAVNGLVDEYKTQETIKDSILLKEKIDTAKWFSGKKVRVVSKTNRAYDW
jgi:hypothetical protein